MVVTHGYRDFIITTRSYQIDEEGSVLASFMYSGPGDAWKVGGPHFCTEHFETTAAAHAGAFRTACILIDALINHTEVPASASKDYANEGDVEVWYARKLGTSAEAVAPTIEIQEAFTGFFAREGFPVRAAVFSKFDAATKIITAYFSAAAALLAKQFEAVPCAKPHREGLVLLAGDDRCWEELFPTQA
ncbi:MAG TPA: hypothetical protein VHB46_06810 [Burkholderiales bacterium]|nr:hypothetical protein [Burkholderiales bacterium]